MGPGFVGIKTGDLVCLIYGTNVPFIVREVEKPKMVRTDGAQDGAEKIPIGEAYFHGLMNGEGMRDLEKEEAICLRIV
jgi:hypothetical protein